MGYYTGPLVEEGEGKVTPGAFRAVQRWTRIPWWQRTRKSFGGRRPGKGGGSSPPVLCRLVPRRISAPVLVPPYEERGRGSAAAAAASKAQHQRTKWFEHE